MLNVLVVGASRGLGASLVKKYATENTGSVFATSRSTEPPKPIQNVTFVTGIDICSPSAGSKLVSRLNELKAKLDVLIITAGYFSTETFDEPKWDDEIKM